MCMMGSPAADRLLTLVKFNIFRTLISNSMTIAFQRAEVMKHEAVSPFTNPSEPTKLRTPILPLATLV
jgi:hypothetical protein